MQENKQEKSQIKRNISLYIQKKGISDYEFYKKSGITRGILSQQNGISEDNIARFLAYAPDVNVEWLLTGKGSMLADERPCVAATPPEEGTMLYLPLIPIDALAGFLSIDNAGVALADCPQYAVPEFSARGAEFLVRVSGESMQPRYNSGDIIACRRLHDAAFLQWGKVYVLDTSQGMLIKHIFQGRRRGSIICHSVNTINYPDFEVPMSDIRSVSIVIGTISLE